MSPEAGLRERKKLRTRKAITDAALRLFERRGYDATTITEIAAAADIAPRTFFAYFPSKEALVFDGIAGDLDRLAERLRERREGETVFEALRAWIADYIADPERAGPSEERRRRLIRETPSLRDHDTVNLMRAGEIVREGVAADLGVPADSLRAR